jgi:hypothetical protein
MRVGSGTPAGPLLERTVAGLSMFFDFTALDQGLPAFAESPVRKGGNKCEKDVHRSLGDGGSASAGCAEDVKMRRAAVERASLLIRCSFFLLGCPVVKAGFRVIDLAEQLSPSTVLLLG